MENTFTTKLRYRGRLEPSPDKIELLMKQFEEELAALEEDKSISPMTKMTNDGAAQ